MPLRPSSPIWLPVRPAPDAHRTWRRPCSGTVPHHTADPHGGRADPSTGFTPAAGSETGGQPADGTPAQVAGRGSAAHRRQPVSPRAASAVETRVPGRPPAGRAGSPRWAPWARRQPRTSRPTTDGAAAASQQVRTAPGQNSQSAGGAPEQVDRTTANRRGPARAARGRAERPGDDGPAAHQKSGRTSRMCRLISTDGTRRVQ